MKTGKNIAFVFALMIVILLSSCSTTVKTSGVRSVSMTPDITRLDIYLKDLVFLGEVEVSYEARRYFSLFNVTESINNQPYNRRFIEQVDIKGSRGLSLNKQLRIAAVKAVNEYPDADFYVPVFTRKTEHKMFLGKSHGEVMRIKAYKFKTN